jgi:hypothetical protein
MKYQLIHYSVVVIILVILFIIYFQLRLKRIDKLKSIIDTHGYSYLLEYLVISFIKVVVFFIIIAIISGSSIIGKIKT